MQMFTEDNPKIENELVLPVLAVRGLVFFPGMMLQFDVARKNVLLYTSKRLGPVGPAAAFLCVFMRRNPAGFAV